MTENQSKKDKKSFFKEWLEQLQQESWQLELLISGLALFGIWESQALLDRFDYFIIVESVSTFRSYLNTIHFVLEAGWAIFLTNLLIHIILRGFWIGAIGLRYVSGDIDYSELNYSERFNNYFRRTIGDFDEYIERIEKASSVIFSFTFLLFFLLLSVILFFTVFGLFTRLAELIMGDSDSIQAVVGLLGGLYFILGILVLIDFFTLGAFKKIKDPTVSRVYFYLYRFFSIVTLSFISRPLLLNFMDSKYTRRLVYLAIPYMIVVVVGPKMVNYDRYPLFPDILSKRVEFEKTVTSIYHRYYDDERLAFMKTFARDSENPPKEKILYASIPSYEVAQGENLKLFIEYREDDEERISSAYKEFKNFRPKELEFNRFWKSREIDDEESEIIIEKVRELRFMRQAVRGKEFKGDSEEERSIYDEYVNYTIDDIDKLESQITSVYNKKVEAYRTKKLREIIKGFMTFNIVRIDGEVVNDQLECKYYVHPNMHERGVRCYYPTDSLTIGEHLLTLDKENCEKCNGTAAKIPFRVIR